MNKCYRVTKYDPSKREANGCFRFETWTSSSDIGEVYDGKAFTLEDYLSIEDGYVVCIKNILALAGCTSLEVCELEDYREGNCSAYKETFNDNLCDIKLKEKQQITEFELDTIIKLILREELWCKLESNNVFIHFGQDLYSYVGICLDFDVSGISVPQGIYIEEFESPYL